MNVRMALETGNLDTLSTLLQSDSYVDAADDAGLTALMLASQKGNLEAVQLLLQHGAGINKCDSRGGTPVYYAVKSDHVEIAEELLNRGADPNFAGDRGMGLLVIAEENFLQRWRNRPDKDWRMIELLRGLDIIKQVYEESKSMPRAEYTENETFGIFRDLKKKRERVCKLCSKPLLLDKDSNVMDFTITCETGCTFINGGVYF